MKRLTKRYPDNSGYEAVHNFAETYFNGYVNYNDLCDCVDKLGELEDIEEIIGCSFLVVFEAIKNGIYDKKGFHYTVILDLDFLRAYPLDLFDEKWQLSDYQKTWWLKEDQSE